MNKWNAYNVREIIILLIVSQCFLTKFELDIKHQATFCNNAIYMLNSSLTNGCSEIFRSFRACNLAMTVRWWWLVVQNWTCTFMRATLKTFSGEERNSFLGVRSVLDEHYKTIKLWCHTVNEGFEFNSNTNQDYVHKDFNPLDWVRLNIIMFLILRSLD